MRLVTDPAIHAATPHVNSTHEGRAERTLTRDADPDNPSDTPIRIRQTVECAKANAIVEMPTANTQLPCIVQSRSEPLLRMRSSGEHASGSDRRSDVMRFAEPPMSLARPPCVVKRQAELAAQALAANGHLEMTLTDAADLQALTACLQENAVVQSLTLLCDPASQPDVWGAISDGQDNALQARSLAASDRAGQAPLMSLFAACRQLRALDLSGCQFHAEQWKCLARSLIGNQSVQRLSIGEANQLDPAVVSHVCALIMRLKNLRTLEIKNTEISIFSLRRLLTSAYGRKGLQSISLNKISCPDGKLQFPQLFQFSEHFQSTLSHLSLIGYPLKMPELNSEALRSNVFSQIRQSRSVRSIDLTDCQLSEKDGETLAAIVAHSSSLEAITLTGNAISDGARESIHATLERNRQHNLNLRRALENRAAATYDLILRNAAAIVDGWPSELSGVLAENSPVEVLDVLAQSIDGTPTSDPQARVQQPAGRRHSHHSHNKAND